jgi:hypothetical protein
MLFGILFVAVQAMPRWHVLPRWNKHYQLPHWDVGSMDGLELLRKLRSGEVCGGTRFINVHIMRQRNVLNVRRRIVRLL